MTFNQNGAFYGHSDEEKPSYVELVEGIRHPIENGTKLFYIDKDEAFRYDAKTKQWYPCASSGGGGGGGGDEYIDLDDVDF